MGMGCAQRLGGRTAMVLVLEQLIGKPKAEQWVDKVVSMVSKSFHSQQARTCHQHISGRWQEFPAVAS